MQLAYIPGLYIQKFVTAFCWTLIHSLWVGLVLALIAAVVMLVTRRSTALIRYQLLSAVFGLFIGLVAFTFYYEYNNGGIHTSVYLFAEYGGYAIKGNTPAIAVIEFVNEYVNLIVLLWLLVAVSKFLMTVKDLRYLQRVTAIKRTGVTSFWNERVKQLSALLGINYGVQLWQSGLVKVPCVIGFLKPMILVPFGFFAHLPVEQAEAILLHELAHIRRCDYFINLLQRLTEIIFFFNPGVLWLSSLIKEERENCCDDIAIKCTGSRKHYIEALVAFHEFNYPPQAVAFAGARSQMYHRMIRIAKGKSRVLSVTESACLLVTLFFIFLLGMSLKTTLPLPAFDTPRITLNENRKEIHHQEDLQAYILAESRPLKKQTIKSSYSHKEKNPPVRVTKKFPQTSVAVKKADFPSISDNRVAENDIKSLDLPVSDALPPVGSLPDPFNGVEMNMKLGNDGFPDSPEQHRAEAAAAKQVSDRAKEESKQAREAHDRIKKMRAALNTI